MTDKVHSVTLILEEDLRSGDAELETLKLACCTFRGIIRVEENVSDVVSLMAEVRAVNDLGSRVIDVIRGGVA